MISSEDVSKQQPRLPHLIHECEQSLSVVLPLSLELTLMGILVTAQEDGQLQTVGV